MPPCRIEKRLEPDLDDVGVDLGRDDLLNRKDDPADHRGNARPDLNQETPSGFDGNVFQGP